MVVRELWQELSQAAFAPAGFEVGFGDGEGLPPIPIPNGGMNAVLRGFIDRVDTWDNGASRYYRVVDYKTGKKDFDLRDCIQRRGAANAFVHVRPEKAAEAICWATAGGRRGAVFPARAPYLTRRRQADRRGSGAGANFPVETEGAASER